MQTRILQRGIIVRVAILSLCGLGLQAAPITYTYSGATFDQGTLHTGGTGNNGDLIPFTTSNYVIGSVTLDAALPGDSALTGYSSHVLSWSMTVVGAFTMSSANHNSLNTVSFGTTGGLITSWDVFSDDGYPVPGQPADWQVARILTASATTFANTQLCTGCVVYDGGLNGSFAQQIVNNGGSVSSPGSWSGAQEAATPEPATLTMLLGGFAMLAAKFRRKF